MLAIVTLYVKRTSTHASFSIIALLEEMHVCLLRLQAMMNNRRVADAVRRLTIGADRE